jgi:hypothetical protein
MYEVLVFNLQFKINFFVEKEEKNIFVPENNSLEIIKFSKDHEKDCYSEKKLFTANRRRIK